MAGKDSIDNFPLLIDRVAKLGVAKYTNNALFDVFAYIIVNYVSSSTSVYLTEETFV